MLKKFKSLFSIPLTLALGAGCLIFPANASTYLSATKPNLSDGIYSTQANDLVETKQLFQADPTIFVDNNTYYLYGTNESDASNGFKVFTSKDMVHWMGPDSNSDGFALKKGDSFGTSGFWAPQVFLHKGTYFMAYTANEQIAIAKSNSPLGPFTQSSQQPLLKNSTYKSIDPYIFFDDDGQKYLYYVELNGGNNICVAKLKDDLSGIEESTKKGCIKATEKWENTENASWPVAEGPTVIKRQGIYYLFYSANDFRNPNYAVGYATSSSPLGPWKKHNGPIISKNNLYINGTGHGDVFADQNNQLYYVLHTHYSNMQPTSRKTAITRLSFTPQKEGEGIFSIDAKSFHYLKEYPYAEDGYAVQIAIDAINALPLENAVTLGDEAAIIAAEKLYNALTDAQKAQVTNAGKLTDLKAKIVTLKVSGWKQVSGKWYYYKNGNKQINLWIKTSNKWYYADSKGVMSTSKWIKTSGKWYYVDGKGIMSINKWIKSNGKYYYVDKNGVMSTNKWVKSSGKWYYVDANGKMLSNTSKKIGKKVYKFNKDGVCTNP